MNPKPVSKLGVQPYCLSCSALFSLAITLDMLGSLCWWDDTYLQRRRR